MALASSAARSLACCGCRQWALRSFIASIGGPSPHFTPPPPRTTTSRAFSSHTRRWNEARERIQLAEKTGVPALTTEETIEEYARPKDEDAETAPFQPPGDHIPWYLQVESPIDTQENVLSARQNLPDLPDHPPPILEPLLKHISVELGMDDLSLLDLRGIDPPPALGANLLMIVGTARSEKHLHFSADKLCRWLRTEHRLRPYADGLLGRQELKLKMKRRAKKSKLLSAVGAKATADSEIDDGIRTGWVCVNLGKVDGGELPRSQEDLEKQKDVVGFGTGFRGSNVVVQLLTEDKRGEIELERLWLAVLKKTQKEKEALLAAVDSAEETISSVPAESRLPNATHATNPLPQSSIDPIGNNTYQRETVV